MQLRKTILISFALIFTSWYGHAQSDTLTINLNDAIEIAQRQSLNAFIAKNTYLSGYWDFRTFRSVLYPNLNLSSTVGSYTSGNEWISADQRYDYRENFYNDIRVSFQQNILPTGGTVSLLTNVNRTFNIVDQDLNYKTVPVQLSIEQPLSGYNSFKWVKKLKPLEYEIIKKEFITDQQAIAQRTVGQFFDVLAAELDLTTAEFNFANADTLYRIGSGRFEIGTITQDELLNLELTRLNAEKTLTSSKLNLQRARTDLNSFLRIPNATFLKCEIPSEVPELAIDVDSAVQLAMDNNPQVLDYERALISSDQTVAQRKSERFQANINLDYGIDQVGSGIEDLYAPPYNNSNLAQLTFSMPLVDWGERKSNYLMSKSRREIEKYRVEQGKIDFEKNVINTIMEFNLQKKQLEISERAEEVGQLGFEVTKSRFMIGKVDVLRLNEARNGMVNSRVAYIRTLESYWNYIYYIQELTLYDFLNKTELTADFEKIVEEQKF